MRTASVAACLLLVAALAQVVPAADAATFATYRASLGSTHGSATLTVSTNGAGSIAVSARALAKGTWTERVYTGSCSHISSTVASLPNLAVGISGRVAKSTVLSAAQLHVASDHPAVIRLVRGRTVICGSFGVINTPAPPAPTPTPTPAPGSTRDNPVPYPQFHAVGDWSVAVYTLNRDAWPIIHAQNQFNEPPALGTQYVMIEITARYKGSTSGDVFFDLFEHVVGDQNVAYNPKTEVLPADCSDVGDVFPGGEVTCNAGVFEVPSGDVASLELYIYTSSSDKVWYALP
jgi:hypothetical protein